MKPVRTLVLLANETEARLMVNEGVGKGLRQIGHAAREDYRDGIVAYADQPGRSRGAPATARHGMQPSTSEQRQMRERFAGHAVDAAAKAWDKGGYERLVIAAPPKMLGALRDALPGRLGAAVTAELDKDLLRVPAAELARHFDGVAAF